MLLLAALAAPLSAEAKAAGETSFLLALIRGESDFTVQSLGNARLSFSAEGSKDVKGTVDLAATLLPGAAVAVSFDVPRAFLKARFPAFRLTVGKTRLSWGEGFVFNAGDVLFGALYRGDQRLFRPYMSLQGHLLVDFAACAGFSLSAVSAPTWDDVWKGSRFSLSLSRAFGLWDLGTLGIRAEAAIVPNGHWTQSADALLPESEGYGLYVYPEVSWSPSDAFGVQLRGMISPIDGSGAGMGSVSWSPLQGLSLAAGASAQFGDTGDLFGWDRTGDLSFFAKAMHRF